MVRHTSVSVPPGTCYGRTDVGLAPSFRREAAEVAERLPVGPFDAVFTSPLERCVRLAGLCGHSDAVRDGRLAEMDFGEWEMRRWETIDDPRLQAWFDDWAHAGTPGGESFGTMYARVASLLGERQAAGERRLLLFTHGGVIACARVYAGLVPVEKAFSPPVPYGGIITVRIPSPDR